MRLRSCSTQIVGALAGCWKCRLATRFESEGAHCKQVAHRLPQVSGKTEENPGGLCPILGDECSSGDGCLKTWVAWTAENRPTAPEWRICATATVRDKTHSPQSEWNALAGEVCPRERGCGAAEK